MLRGQPGVEVNGSRITIRGAASFYGSTEPLIVVDGIIVSSLEGISPQSVKSIEILKDSSSSIYGSRGANGVILITLFSGPDRVKQ
jgi:TonB-dependent SusC/RagA subfamily outer membrane receptor